MPQYFFQTDTNKGSHSQSCLNKNIESTTEFPRTFSQRRSETRNQEECADPTRTETQVPAMLSLGGFGWGGCLPGPQGWCTDCCSPFVLPSADWGRGGVFHSRIEGWEGLGVQETNSSPQAAQDTHGQQVLMGVPIVGQPVKGKDCRTGRQTDMDSNLRHATS